MKSGRDHERRPVPRRSDDRDVGPERADLERPGPAQPDIGEVAPDRDRDREAERAQRRDEPDLGRLEPERREDDRDEREQDADRHAEQRRGCATKSPSHRIERRRAGQRTRTRAARAVSDPAKRPSWAYGPHVMQRIVAVATVLMSASARLSRCQLAYRRRPTKGYHPPMRTRQPDRLADLLRPRLHLGLELPLHQARVDDFGTFTLVALRLLVGAAPAVDRRPDREAAAARANAGSTATCS